MVRGTEGPGVPEQPAAPPERNGWKLYQWKEFGSTFANLVREVERLEAADPTAFRDHPTTKRLAAIFRLVTEIISRDPNAPGFRQGNTLGTANRHWFSAGFYERYRLFFRFRSDARAIVYAWVNDEDAKRARGSRTDAYAVFERMLQAGAPPITFPQDSKEARMTAETAPPAEGEPLIRPSTVDHPLYDAVVEACRTVFDPEIPVNIYDLGLVYTIEISDESDVGVTITLTAPGCPVAGEMPGWVAEAVLAVPGVRHVDVDQVWEPMWGMDMMSDEARLELGFM
jgi:FeS assembly SUF system protein